MNTQRRRRRRRCRPRSPRGRSIVTPPGDRGQSTSMPGRVVAVGVRVVRARPQQPVARRPLAAADASSARRGLPYQRLCGSPSTSTRRCTTTGTSSRPPPSAASASTCRTRSRSRGRSTQLRPEQVKACVDETHRDEQILAAEPYPGAVETVRALARRRALHPRHLPPRASAHGATAHWLERIGLPYDELYCSCDKVTRCRGDRHRRADRRLAGQPARGARRRHRRRDARAPVEPRALRGRGHRAAPRTGPELARRLAPLLAGHAPMRDAPAGPARPRRDDAARAPARDRARAPGHRLGPLGARRGPDRPHASTTSSTTTGSAARSRGSRTSRPPAARCWSPTTPARCRPTRR